MRRLTDEPGSAGAGTAPGVERDLGAELCALRPRMTRVALRFAPRDAADDIVQGAFEKALRNLHRFRGHARFSTWLHRFVVNEALMWLRSERRRRVRELDLDDCGDPAWESRDPDPAERLVASRRHALLHAGLARLPRDERDVLLRCGLGDVSYEAFGRETGLRAAAAKSRAFRARRKLRAWLEERIDDASRRRGAGAGPGG